MLFTDASILKREKVLYEELLDKLSQEVTALQQSASAVADIDLLACFAEKHPRAAADFHR